jgi:hypothetical protein
MTQTNFGNLGATIPSKTDKPIAIVPALEAFVNSIGTGKGKGKLLIVQNTGAAAWESIKGDATLAEDGTLKLAGSSAPRLYTPSIVTASQSRASTTYGVLSTADEISGIVIPGPTSILEVMFSLRYSSTVTNAGAVSLFLGTEQIRAPENAGFVEALSAGSGVTQRLFSNPGSPSGLTAGAGSGAEAKNAVVGGWLPVSHIEAGTYAVSLRFRASSGSISADNRVLYARVHTPAS